MTDNTGIEWTHRPGTIGETWNLVVGCSLESPGCTHCYAMSMAARIEKMTAELIAQGKRGSPHYNGTTKMVKGSAVWTGLLNLAPDSTVFKPLRWSKPRTVFVNSMSDMFHEKMPDAWIDLAFAVMAMSQRHTFQILTKRAWRMRAYLGGHWASRVLEVIATIKASENDPGLSTTQQAIVLLGRNKPLPHVWIGISAERQQEANIRIPDLMRTPAALRFVSAEPLLGEIDFTAIRYDDEDCKIRYNVLTGEAWVENSASPSGYDNNLPKLDWIITGGESGKKARPMHPSWPRSVRDQCQQADVCFFMKQWGEWLPGEANRGQFDPRPMHAYRRCDNHSYEWPNSEGPVENFGTHPDRFSGDLRTRRVGKKVAGSLLDGVSHKAFPEPRNVNHIS